MGVPVQERKYVREDTPDTLRTDGPGLELHLLPWGALPTRLKGQQLPFPCVRSLMTARRLECFRHILLDCFSSPLPSHPSPRPP